MTEREDKICRISHAIGVTTELLEQEERKGLSCDQIYINDMRKDLEWLREELERLT